MKLNNARPTLLLRLAKWSALPLCLLFTGCGEAPDASSNGADATTEVTMDAEGMMPARRQKAFKKIFHAVPSPIETAMLLERSGIQFDAEGFQENLPCGAFPHRNGHVARAQRHPIRR